jgi:hypothetical protein
MDRLDMRGTHQHHEVSQEEIQAIVDRQPEAKATDKPSNRNTRWFAEVALVKKELQRLGDLMLPSGKDLSAMMEEEMPLRDLYKRLYIVSKKSFNTDDEDHVEALIERRMGEVQDAARSCKDRLQAMKHEIEAFRVELGPDYSGSEVKMRQTMHGSLCKRLHKLVHEFQAMQVERKEQYGPAQHLPVLLPAILHSSETGALCAEQVQEGDHAASESRPAREGWRPSGRPGARRCRRGVYG